MQVLHPTTSDWALVLFSHFLADHKSAFTEIPTYVEKLAPMTYGFSGAVGYDIGNLALDLRYENALTTIGDHVFLVQPNQNSEPVPIRLHFLLDMASDYTTQL